MKALGCIGVDAADARDRGDDERAFGEGGAGAGGDIEIAGGIDHHIGEEGLAAFLGFDDDALDHAVLDDGGGEPAVKAEIDAGFAHHVVGGALEAVGVERGGEDDRMRRGAGVKVEEIPAGPFLPHGLGLTNVGLAVRFGRHHGEVPFLHALDDLHAQTLDGDFEIVVHVIEHQHHAAGGKAAEIGIAFQERDISAVACGRHRG